MSVLNNWRSVGAPFGNAADLITVTYDFAKDGGAVATYDVLTASGDIICELVAIDVETTATSGGSAVVDLGKGSSGTEFKSNLAVASIAANSIIAADTVGLMVRLTSGDKICANIQVAALTAGKFHMMFRIYKRK